ncbi:MAG TPA: type II toxin-antitoxin system VapC family toxin [Allosphingosinicella sp.]
MTLLDTHVLIWFVQANERLGAEARRHIEHALAHDEAMVSAITFWEIAMLVRRRRVSLTQPVQTWIDALCDKSGIGIADVSRQIATAAGDLGEEIHGDPIDRIIIATARHCGAPLLTADRAILAYGAAGHVETIDATR